MRLIDAAPPPDFLYTCLFWCPRAVKLIIPGQLTHLSPNYLLTDRLSGRSNDGRPRSAVNGFVSQAVVDWWMLLHRVALWLNGSLDRLPGWRVSETTCLSSGLFSRKHAKSCHIHPGMPGQILTWSPPSFAAIYFTTWKDDFLFFFFFPHRRCTTPSRARSCSGHCKFSYMDTFYFCCEIKQRKEREPWTGTTACAKGVE